MKEYMVESKNLETARKNTHILLDVYYLSHKFNGEIHFMQPTK